MHIVLVSILTVQVIVQTGKDDRTAGAAAGSGAVGALESCSLTRELVDVRCLDYRIPVTPGIPSPIIADKEDNVLPRRGMTSGGGDKGKQEQFAQERFHEARHHEVSG